MGVRCRSGKPLSHRRPSLISATSSATLTDPLVSLSPDARNATAILRHNDTTVYVIATSHVSKRSVQIIQEVFQAVQPDAVLLELCKDRVDLLLDPKLQSVQNPRQRWHVSSVTCKSNAAPLPNLDSNELLKRIVPSIRPSMPLSRTCMERAAVSLLASGLFGSIRIECGQAPSQAFASYGVAKGQTLETILPLGPLTFHVTERSLPMLQSLSIDAALQSMLPSTASTNDLIASTLDAAKKQQSTLRALLALRAQLVSLLACDKDVVFYFDGVQEGHVIVKKALRDAGMYTGLEPSAAQGRGVGITSTLQLPPLDARVDGAAAWWDNVGPAILTPWHNAPPPPSPQPSSPSAPPSPSLTEQFATALTRPYAQAQNDAGLKCNVEPGEAWRVALQAAAASSASLVLLGDRPTSMTRLRLANAIVSQLLLRAASVMALAGGIVVAAPMSSLPVDGSLVGVATGLAATWFLCAAPILQPLQQIRALASKSSKEIESIVLVRESIQERAARVPGPLKLWGEDALLEWPGALGPIIHQRDRFMVASLQELLRGKATVPAYLLTRGGQGSGEMMYRYGVAANGPSKVNPNQGGEGTYIIKSAGAYKRIVAVVGSAHVPGMVRAWDETISQDEMQRHTD